MTALHWAAFHGRTGHVKLLVEKKADLLSRDADGKLPLHWAAQVNYEYYYYYYYYYYNIIMNIMNMNYSLQYNVLAAVDVYFSQHHMWIISNSSRHLNLPIILQLYMYTVNH